MARPENLEELLLELEALRNPLVDSQVSDFQKQIRYNELVGMLPDYGASPDIQFLPEIGDVLTPMEAQAEDIAFGGQETPIAVQPTARVDHARVITDINKAATEVAPFFGLSSRPTAGARNPLELIYLQEQRLDPRGPERVQRSNSRAKGYLQSQEQSTADAIMHLLKRRRNNNDILSNIESSLEGSGREADIDAIRKLREIVDNAAKFHKKYRSENQNQGPGGAQYLAAMENDVDAVMQMREDSEDGFIDVLLHMAYIDSSSRRRNAYVDLLQKNASDTSTNNVSDIITTLNKIQSAGIPIPVSEMQRLLGEQVR